MITDSVIYRIAQQTGGSGESRGFLLVAGAASVASVGAAVAYAYGGSLVSLESVQKKLPEENRGALVNTEEATKSVPKPKKELPDVLPQPTLEKPDLTISEALEEEPEDNRVDKEEPTEKAEVIEERERESVQKELPEENRDTLINVEDDANAKAVTPKSSDEKKEADELDLNPASIATDKDLHKRIARVREDLEAELLRYLKLQAQAHADHLADAVDVQKREMHRVHLRELDEMLEGATLSHRRELAAVMGHVRGLQVRKSLLQVKEG